MSRYLIGILLALATPALHAAANILDSYFANQIFRRVAVLICFSTLANLLFLPIVFLADPPHLLPPKLLWVIGVIALIEVAYQYPYLWALRRVGTSVVTSLFAFGKIFTPVFALLLVGESLTVYQYLGFFGITICGALLSLDLKRLRMNTAFWLMLIVSVTLSAQTVLYKYAFENGGEWASVLLYSSLAEVIIACGCMVTPQNARALKHAVTRMRNTGPWLVLGQILTLGGTATGTLALFLIPTSVVKGIEDAQGVFVLVYMGLLGGRSAKIVSDQRSRLKIFLVISIFIGALLVAVPIGK